LENLEEIDKFLDTYDPPKLNQQDINKLKRSRKSNEIDASIISQQRKVDQQIHSSLYQTFKELTPVLLKLLHKTEREKTRSMKSVLP
jgi:hypothetical protein